MGRKRVSGIMLTLLLFSILTLRLNVQLARASGTIHIGADGSIDPATAPIERDGEIYTFTDNIFDEIEVRRSNMTIDGNGYIVQGTGAYDSSGIYLGIVSNVTIKNVEISTFDTGIEIYESSNNSIHSCIIRNTRTGILFWGTWGSSDFNSIFRNSLIDNFCGVHMSMASDSSIYGNNITNNDCGIFIGSGSNNIYENNIKNNSDFGIRLMSSESNIYHNNFINNNEQVARRGETSTNYWDDGYPSGGNYWSDYTGIDAGGDGIGDASYVIDDTNQDRYPLMNPWGEIPIEEEVLFWTQWWFYAIVAVVIVTLAGAAYFLKKRKQPTTTPILPEGTEL